MRRHRTTSRYLSGIPTAVVLVVTQCVVLATAMSQPVASAAQAAVSAPVLSRNEPAAEAPGSSSHQEGPSGWTTDAPTPIAQNHDPEPRFTAVSAGARYSCGLRSDGSVVCWGNNIYGQATPPGGSFTQVSTGNWHSCGLRSDGSVVCWGNNNAGAGDASGGFVHPGLHRPTGIRVGYVRMGRWSAGVTTTMGGRRLRGVRSPRSPPATGIRVGYVRMGRWSAGVTTGGEATVPGGSFTQVSVGVWHSCGLRTDGSIECWGDNEFGRLDVPGGSFTQVSAGVWHSCGLRSDGSVVCWGNNRLGRRRRRGVRSPRSPPATGIRVGYVRMGRWSAGVTTTMGRRRLRGVRSPRSPPATGIRVGYVRMGRWSAGVTTTMGGRRRRGVRSPRSPPAAGIRVGYVRMGRWSAGVITGTGRRRFRGVRSPRSPPAAGIRVGYVRMGRWSAGVTATMGRRRRRGVRSPRSPPAAGIRVGYVRMGRWSAGVTTTYGQATPPGGSFTQVSAGVWHSCGLRSDGSVVCWGNSNDGQATPPGGSFTQVSAGRGHSCGLRSDGSVVCWGNSNDGQATPPGGSFTQVSAGDRHSCGLRSDGSVVCWDRHSTFLLAGPGATGAESESLPVVTGRVEGVGYEVIEFGRNLFWSPLAGITEYEIDAREAGRDRPDYRSGIGCHYTGTVGARCGYLFEEDKTTSEAFRGASEFRVRAVNQEGTDPWSDWVDVDPPDGSGHVVGVRYSVGGWFVDGVTGSRFSRDVVGWDPVVGARSYDIGFEHDGQSPSGLVEDVIDGDRGSCGDRCRYEFWRNPGLGVRVRVRAVNDSDVGLWSGWVSLVREPDRAPPIVDLVELKTRNPFDTADHVRVYWSPVKGAAGYEVAWRYRDYTGSVGDVADADNNARRARQVLEWMNDSDNYRLINPGRATVAHDVSDHVVKDVVNNRESADYLLEFRVTALGDDGIRKESNWVRWNSKQIHDRASEVFKCEMLDIGSVAWSGVSVILALYSGGLSQAALAALKAGLTPGLFQAGAALVDCLDTQDPVEFLKQMSPFIGHFLDIVGMDELVDHVTCGNRYLGTQFRDRNFEFEDIDGLLQACDPNT